MSCRRCCGCLFIVTTLLATLMLALLPAAYFPDWYIYYQDWVLHKAKGVRYHLDQDADGNRLVTHARKTVILRYKDVERRLSELPIALDQENSGVYHLAALAENDISDAVYEGASTYPHIALGAPPKIHKLMRSFLNKRLSKAAPSSLWNAQMLTNAAEKFLAETADQLDIETAACAWVDVEMWRILLQMDVPREDATRLCSSYQPAFLVHAAILPSWARQLPGDPFGFAKMRASQRAYLDRFQRSKPLRAHANEDEEQIALLAHVSHDAIAVAGGLSVPHLISRVLWLLYNGTGVTKALNGQAPPLLIGDRRVLDEPSLLRKFVLETARLFPEVTHVPLSRHGKPELVSIEAALVDQDFWGSGGDGAPDGGQKTEEEEASAFAFRLDRPQDQHGAYGTAWAHQANTGGLALQDKHTARGCPGMGLSLALIEAFVTAFVRQKDAWRLPEATTSLAYGGTLERVPTQESGKKQEL